MVSPHDQIWVSIVQGTKENLFRFHLHAGLCDTLPPHTSLYKLIRYAWRTFGRVQSQSHRPIPVPLNTYMPRFDYAVILFIVRYQCRPGGGWSHRSQEAALRHLGERRERGESHGHNWQTGPHTGEQPDMHET